MGSGNTGYVNQNSTTSGIGTGFPAPLALHQGIDAGKVNPQYLSQENNNRPQGLRINGGSYNVPEHIAANNHHSHPAYKSDHGRFMSYQFQNITDGHHFLQ